MHPTVLYTSALYNINEFDSSSLAMLKILKSASIGGRTQCKKGELPGLCHEAILKIISERIYTSLRDTVIIVVHFKQQHVQYQT